MKNILRILVLTIIMFFVPNSVFGAVHSGGERFPTDTWYSVTPREPYWQLFYNTALSSDTYLAGGELYQNDQTFFRVDSAHVMGIFRNTQLAASYLFDCGFFIGVSDSKTNGSNRTMFSPGYRLSFDENSYAALSLDYTSSSSTNKITGYELNLRYFLDNAKISGNIYVPAAGDAEWDAEVTYAIGKHFVIGCDYVSDEDSITAGFTWIALPVIIDFKYYNSNVDEYGYYNLSGMIKLGENCGLGLQYKNYIDDPGAPQYTVTFKFTADKANLKIFFTPKNESVDQSYGLAYYKSF